MLQRTILASLTTLCLATPSAAFDLLDGGYDWAGVYMGVKAGLVSNNSSLDMSVKSLEDQSTALKDELTGDQSSLMGGGLIGYNIQASNLLLGFEADLNYLGYSDTKSKLQDYDVYATTRDATFDASWFGTLRARSGITAAGFLIYGTAGLATGNMQATATIKAIDPMTGDVAQWKGSTAATSWGWTAGGGIEYGISNVSFGLEYLYVDLGSEHWSGKQLTDDIDSLSKVNGTAHYQFGITTATAKLHF